MMLPAKFPKQNNSLAIIESRSHGRLSIIYTFAHLHYHIPSYYDVGIGGGHMKKRWIYLDEAEWQLIISALNELRNRLIAEGRYTDVVDEVMLKIINAPIKKVKTA